jgi:hypothetical protein
MIVWATQVNLYNECLSSRKLWLFNHKLPKLVPSWSHLGPSWGIGSHLGAILGHLGAMFGNVGLSWGILSQLGASLV